jgi:hypothetical protein
MFYCSLTFVFFCAATGLSSLLCTNNYFVMMGPTMTYVVNVLPLKFLFEDVHFYLYNIRNGEVFEHGLYPCPLRIFFLNLATVVR